MSQAITAGIATANQFGQAAREAKGDSLGKSDFLLLLVTQFKHQDPLNPLDDKEFVAQLAQFSSLEQLMNLNTSMDGLTAATQNQQMMNAANYINRDVVAGGRTIAKTDAGVSKFYWGIGESDMAKGAIYVYGPDGSMIYSEALGPRAAGSSDIFEWSGKNYAGQEALPGVYYISIACEDANGQGMLVDMAVTGRVVGVTFENGETNLRLEDGRLVALRDVRGIAAPPTPPNSGNAADSGDTGGNGDAGTGA